jgi:REP element-mobilizing transposase RayT
MAEPPRLPAIYLRWEQSVIYFVTLCVAGRQQILANEKVQRAIAEITAGLRSWEVIAGIVMPKHVHCFVCPRNDRELSVGDFSNAFKRLLRQRLGEQDWEWQRGCFDHLLRSDESFSDKWAYVRENPVRASLVQRWEEWPYFFGLIEEQRVEEQKLGKLTASPTTQVRGSDPL